MNTPETQPDPLPPAPGSALVAALSELNRHIESLETIGGCGVTSSIASAKMDRRIIVAAIAASPNDPDQRPGAHEA